MKKKTVCINHLEYDTIEDGLEEESIELISVAEEKLKNAYAPYSIGSAYWLCTHS